MTPEMTMRAAALLDAYKAKRLKIATAESCTGGLVAALLTEISGSSAVVERGFVTYSNEAKTELIGVPADLIATCGAVSEPVARAMAEGALAQSQADVAVGITGVAGPTGGTATKPVGLVHFGLARKGSPTVHLERRYGDLGRENVRRRAVEDALSLLEQALR
ncbi:CinA family protein [Microvirga lotononidis]|uniref:Competence/damage-inducible protein CinA-like protein n=1 Tax=Microvirga lotononidis TaxID=864069 RepID=I4Z0M1_9HYPH|nr:CinA family protein [Microvirga lotononidis]EIM29763.1 competence/damage-inducible protein CinA-like protein [Microvirga lotononidis]WQO26938.1 CinA family protein [Microvirga lotononidis]